MLFLNDMKTLKFGYINFWDGFNQSNEVFLGFNKILSKLPYKFVIVDPMVEEADFVFASVFYWDEYSFRNCKGNPIKILFNGESLPNAYYEYDYSISMESQTTTNLYFPYFVFREVDDKRGLVENPFDRKFCSFVVSNDKPKLRLQAFEILNTKYKDVASGGKAFNNIGGAVDDKIDFIKDYKFNICFENTYKDGYVTEKIYDAFMGYTIPIYFGGKVVSKIFNKDAFIDCTNKDGQYLLDRVRELDENKELYMEMLEQPMFVNPNFKVEKLAELHNFLLAIFKAHFGE